MKSKNRYRIVSVAWIKEMITVNYVYTLDCFNDLIA